MTADLIQRLRFLASGQDDVRSMALDEAANALEAMAERQAPAEGDEALAERLRDAYHSKTRIGHPMWKNLDTDRKEPWLAVARAARPNVQPKHTGDIAKLAEALARIGAAGDPARLSPEDHAKFCKDAHAVQSWCNADGLRRLLAAQAPAPAPQPLGYLSEHTGPDGPYKWQFSKDLAGVYRDTALRIIPVYEPGVPCAAVAHDVSGFTDAHACYVARWGGSCRDCADENGVCPNSGLPCGGADKAISHVFKALAYGVKHGYISNPLGTQAQSGWRPIETAPKDGSMFLCWVRAVRYGETDEGQQYQEDASQVDFCWWRDGVDGNGYFDPACGQIGDGQDVTHWMPLPAPPESKPPVQGSES